MTERSFYLSDFADEVMPCDPTLEAWAAWLGTGGNKDWPVEVPNDGASFEGSAIEWLPDIIATRDDGGWSLSRDPADDDFVAVRWSQGSGWSPDNIVYPGFPYAEETMRGALLAFLSDDANGCEDVEYIAVGKYENGWRFTFRAGPPPKLEPEREH